MPGSPCAGTIGPLPPGFEAARGFQLLLCLPKGLVTNYGEGGATKREGGHVKFYPYGNGGGGAEKVLAMLKGVTKSLGVVFTQ